MSIFVIAAIEYGIYQIALRSIFVVLEARIDYRRWVAENWQTA